MRIFDSFVNKDIFQYNWITKIIFVKFLLEIIKEDWSLGLFQSAFRAYLVNKKYLNWTSIIFESGWRKKERTGTKNQSKRWKIYKEAQEEKRKDRFQG